MPGTRGMMTYYKILTHDYRPPVWGGEPIWDGKTLPYELPRVALDTSMKECSYGWNFVADLAAGFRIAGLWPSGWPSVAIEVRPLGRVVECGDKNRVSRLRLLRVASNREVREAITALSAPFKPHVEEMVEEQMAWRAALARPQHDPATVNIELQRALGARGLATWKLRRFKDARDARASWYSWYARDAWGARGARDAWYARDAWGSWGAIDVMDAWDARGSWGAMDVMDAFLAMRYAVCERWPDHDPALLTSGIREAYAHGLAIAVPIGEEELGWVMV